MDTMLHVGAEAEKIRVTLVNVNLSKPILYRWDPET